MPNHVGIGVFWLMGGSATACKRSPRKERCAECQELLALKAAIKAFDEKLAKLGYDGDHAPKRSHHKDDADKKPA